MIKNDILNGNHLEMYQILLNICIQIIWVQIQIFGVPQIRENLKYTSICNFFSTYLVDDMNGHMGHSQQWSNQNCHNQKELVDTITIAQYISNFTLITSSISTNITSPTVNKNLKQENKKVVNGDSNSNLNHSTKNKNTSNNISNNQNNNLINNTNTNTNSTRSFLQEDTLQEIEDFRVYLQNYNPNH